MRLELVLGLSFGLGLAVALLVTPLAMRLANVTGFLDKPHTYKGHASATPYLGGIALVTAVMAVVTFTNVVSDEVPVAVALGLLSLLVVGTIDDKLNLDPWLRVGLTSSIAVGLWAGDVGWNLGNPVLDVTLTVLWVLGVVNAFNLMDNMDGASTSVGAASTLGIAVLAVLWDSPAIAAVALGSAGACLGFLRYNLAGDRARIFLGDGGSMPLGVLVAVLAMALSHTAQAGNLQFLLAAVPFVGACALDTALVMFSRRRRGARLWSGGRDHLTHRLRERLGGRRLVAASLAGLQLCLGAIAVGLAHAPLWLTISGAVAYVVFAVLSIRRLDSEPWRTTWMREADVAAREEQRTRPHARPARAST